MIAQWHCSRPATKGRVPLGGRRCDRPARDAAQIKAIVGRSWLDDLPDRPRHADGRSASPRPVRLDRQDLPQHGVTARVRAEQKQRQWQHGRRVKNVEIAEEPFLNTADGLLIKRRRRYGA